MAEPRLEIIEQPKSRGYRFRYECEGSSHGNITGATSSKGQRTFPTVQLINWPGPARISVQCVTDEEKPKPHTHELIGKNCKDGICVIELKPSDNNIAKFDGLSIKHSTRKRAIEILTLRNQEAILQEKRQKSLSQGLDLGNDLKLTEAEKQKATEEAKITSPNLDLSVVRLLFKANLLKGPNGPVFKTLEVVSNPIYDAKSPGAAALRICRMDKSSGSCVGGEEIFLLCDKVQKDDIAVCFEEYDADGVLKWESYGKFGPQDVHRQFAIVFRTPQYRSTRIDSPVQVQVKLKRLSKPEESNVVLFTYHPEQQDEDQIKRKKKKKLNYNLLERFPNHGSNNIHSVCPAPSNGVVTGNVGVKRNNIQQVCNHPAMSSNVQGNTQNQSVADGHHNGGALFPLTTMLPSMTLPNVAHMMPSPQAPSPASSYMLSPKQSPSPQSVSDQSIEYYQPLEYDIPMYEQVSPYQGRGLSEKDSQPCVKPAQTRQLHSEFLNQPIAVLDLSKPKPLDLTVQKIKTDSDCICESSIKATIDKNEAMKNMKNIDKMGENCEVLQTKPCDADSQLTKQVIAFGDRLFRALLKYAQTADTSILLMVQRQLLTQQDENGDNVLHLAVIHNKLDALRNLLNVARTLTDCDVVNQTNNRHQTPLHLATILRDAVLVEVLLCSNASITMVDSCGNSPIHLAVIHKAPECLKLMIGCLLQKNKGKSPEVNRLNYKGLAPLHLAVQAGHIDCIKALVEIGKANINIEDGCSGKTPLHYAVEKDQLAIVGYLINQPNIDVNAPDFSGFTPLHVAVMLKLQGCAALLMAVGADPDAEIIEKVADSDDESSSECDVEAVDQNRKERQKQKEAEKDVVQVDGETEEADEPPADTVIKTAWTLAEGDDTMERILHCEECKDPGHTLESMRIHECLHKVASEVDNHLYTGVPGSGELDMMELDPLVRKQLADLLDPAQPEEDWKALAHKLNMLPSLIEVFSYMSSPTKALLDNYESTGGSVENLRRALIDMKRLDAAKLIDEVKKQKEIARYVHGKISSWSAPFDLAQVESGIGSMTFGI